MPGLMLDNVGMAYGPRVLFGGLSAELTAGETLAVTGANGSGKSTLLKIAARLLRPDEGAVRWAGTVGYAAPDVNVYAELTGRENLAFFAGLRGVPDVWETLLTRVGLSEQRGGELVGTYSSGMRQRLKLAVSLLGAPSLLVWDEPTMALDSVGGRCVEEILDEHRQGGGVAVIATNDAHEAERWSRGGLRIDLGDF